MTIYLPIVDAERSQLAGLARATDAVKARLRPLLQVHSAHPGGALAGRARPGSVRGRELGGEQLGAAQLGAEQLACVVAEIARCWGPNRPALIDWRGDPRRSAAADLRRDARLPDARVADGRVALAVLLDEARTRGLEVVPVTGLGRSAAHQLAVADAAHEDGRGVCLRVEPPDLGDLGALPGAADAVLAMLGVPADLVDLVVDLGPVPRDHHAALAATARDALAVLSGAAPWRSVTFAASALPPEVPPDAPPAAPVSHTVPRAEWQLWRALADARPREHPPPAFGDYCVRAPHAAHPSAEDAPAPSLFYTTGDAWLVLDATTADRAAGGPAAPVDPCTDLIARGEFFGATHCSGDACFADCCAHSPDEGDGAWQAATTTHHLTVVVEQLADHARGG